MGRKPNEIHTMSLIHDGEVLFQAIGRTSERTNRELLVRVNERYTADSIESFLNDNETYTFDHHIHSYWE